MTIKNIIQQAVTILREGGLVAMPTETVYGLAADARQPDALRKIFQAKQRPVDHPLIVHLANISQLSDWTVDISDSALLLAQTFWPGPLTLILKKKPSVLDLITGHQETVGLRIPNHPVAQALLGAFGGGLAAPSANRFGRISPTTAEAVREELGETVDLVLEGGACAVGVESTIVDMSGECPVILRPGMITAQQIEDVLKQPVANAKKNAPRVSGSLESHYAPRTKMQLINTDDLSLFLQTVNDFPIAVMSHHPLAVAFSGVHIVSMPNTAESYAHDLYHVLRELDKKGFTRIIVESVPDDMEWNAVRDRLNRASA